MRAHNLLYALGGALAVPTVPTASRYVATGDERRLRELAVRGSRYTLALFVPLCVTLMALARSRSWRLARRPLRRRRHRADDPRVVLAALRRAGGDPGLPRGRGEGAPGGAAHGGASPRRTSRLSLVLTPELGVEGPALATTIPFVLAFPLMLRNGLLVTGVSVSELVRRAFAPAYWWVRCSRPSSWGSACSRSRPALPR